MHRTFTFYQRILASLNINAVITSDNYDCCYCFCVSAIYHKTQSPYGNIIKQPNTSLRDSMSKISWKLAGISVQ